MNSNAVGSDGGKPMFLKYASPMFARACIKYGLQSDSEAYNKVLAAGSCQNIEGVPYEITRVFVVSGDLSWEEHVRVQACAQRFLSNSVSKTINMPRGTPQSDVCKAYVAAWKMGCCGLTVFVTGSRDGVVLEAGSK